MPKSISKRKLFTEIGYHPHKGQTEISTSPARFKVAACGRRFGKSDMGGHDLLPEAYLAYFMRKELQARGVRREFWIVGPNYSDSEKEFRVLWNALTKLEMPFDRPGTYNDPLGGNMHISLWNGLFQVHAKSASHPESLVGEGLHGVILSEAAKLKPSVWTKYIRPTLADFSGWALMTSTPEGKNWFYDAWRTGQDPESVEWSSWRRPAWLNPYVYRTPTRSEDVKIALARMANPKLFGGVPIFEGLTIDAEVQSLLRDLTEVSFMQEIGAEFTEFVGRVFGDFDEEINVAPLAFQPTWETYGGVDYGFTNPNVWLLIQVGPWGEIHVVDEVYEPGLTAPEFAEEIKSRGLAPTGMLGFYPDPSSPGDSRILENVLKVKARGGTGGELKNRIDAIREVLKIPLEKQHLPLDHPERQPRLRISPRCINLIRDMQDYRYPEKRSQEVNGPENPLKRDDHGPEALGRFMAGRFGTPQRLAKRARVTSAAFGR